MGRAVVPARLVPMVRQCKADFVHVTRVWVRRGWHSDSDVEQMHAAVLEIVQSGDEQEIEDVCRLWSGIAQRAERG